MKSGLQGLDIKLSTVERMLQDDGGEGMFDFIQYILSYLTSIRYHEPNAQFDPRTPPNHPNTGFPGFRITSEPDSGSGRTANSRELLFTTSKYRGCF